MREIRTPATESAELTKRPAAASGTLLTVVSRSSRLKQSDYDCEAAIR